jgi:hypothetical protein
MANLLNRLIVYTGYYSNSGTPGPPAQYINIFSEEKFLVGLGLESATYGNTA